MSRNSRAGVRMAKSNLPVVTYKWFITTVTWLEIAAINNNPSEIVGQAKVLMVKTTNENVAKLFAIKFFTEKFDVIDGVPQTKSGKIVLFQNASAVEAILPLQTLLNSMGGNISMQDTDDLTGNGTDGSSADEGASGTASKVGKSNIYVLRPKRPKK